MIKSSDIYVNTTIQNINNSNHHRTHRHNTQYPGGVPDGRPIGLPPGGWDGGLATGPTAGGGGTVEKNGRAPGPTRTLTTTGNNDRGLADSAAVHSKQDGAGGIGMA